MISSLNAPNDKHAKKEKNESVLLNMSSWSNSTRGFPTKKQEVSISVSKYFQPTEGGICSNFNQFFYSYLYCEKNVELLYVYDKPNCVSNDFLMFKSILNENSLIKYLKEIPKDSNRMNYNTIVNNHSLSAMPFSRMKKTAQSIFSFNSSTQEKITTLIREKGLERIRFDIGIHIRSGDKITTGEMKTIQISEYIRAIRTIQSKLNKKELNIFVMTDNYTLYEELVARGDSSWSITTLQEPSAYTNSGHTQFAFNLLSQEKRFTLFYQFLTELHIMQRIPNLVLTFSSNVGRFLYLTSYAVQDEDNVISLDVPKWSTF